MGDGRLRGSIWLAQQLLGFLDLRGQNNGVQYTGLNSFYGQLLFSSLSV